MGKIYQIGQKGGQTSFHGNLALSLNKAQRVDVGKRTHAKLYRNFFPDSPPTKSKDLNKEISRWKYKSWFRLYREAWRAVAAESLGLAFWRPSLSLTVVRANGDVLPLGLASLRVVTTAGVNFLTDAFQNTVEIELMNFHGIGTGTTAAAIGDTDIETEITTQYNPDNTRATGTQGENGANVYQTVGTNAVDASVACTEHGVLSSATVGAGTLWDRHTFTVINLGNGDSLQSTYELTSTAGG